MVINRCKDVVIRVKQSQWAWLNKPAGPAGSWDEWDEILPNAGEPMPFAWDEPTFDHTIKVCARHQICMNASPASNCPRCRAAQQRRVCTSITAAAYALTPFAMLLFRDGRVHSHPVSRARGACGCGVQVVASTQRDRMPSPEEALEVNLDAVNVAATIYVQSRNMPHPALLPPGARHDPREKLKYLSDNAKKVRARLHAVPLPACMQQLVSCNVFLSVPLPTNAGWAHTAACMYLTVATLRRTCKPAAAGARCWCVHRSTGVAG